MSYYTIALKAGVPFQQNTAGKLLLIDSIGSAPGVDVQLVSTSGSAGTVMPLRLAAFRIVQEFSAAVFTSPVDTVLGVFMSSSDVQLALNGVTINNSAGSPVPVNFAGTVAPVIGTLNNDDAHAVPMRKQALSTLVDMAPVSVGTVATALVSDTTLKRLTIRNSHATATVAIGGAGVTLANGARVLAPGDMWVEEDAAGAAWYAISDTAGVSVQIGGAK